MCKRVRLNLHVVEIFGNLVAKLEPPLPANF